MSLANSKASETYQEALSATTSGWEDTGIGFTERSSPPNITVISRQLNTVLFAILKVNTELETIQQKISTIQQRIAILEGRKPQADIEGLSTQLRSLQLGKVIKEPKGTIKVYENPFELLKKIT